MRSRSGRRSTSGVLKFWVLGTRNIDSQYSNQDEMLSYAWLRHAMIIDHIMINGKGQGQVTKGHYM